MDERERMELLSAVEEHWRGMERERQRKVRIGWWMAAFLAVGTVIEYAIGVALDWNLPLMVAINVAEAAAIIIYFMHLPNLWHGDEAGKGH